ncbi:MAG: type III-B CRISPR module RAMP protein Cmr6 [Deltaproteobacteria bacterium]|nr:type III-B CRISPR module RAMP protein Cmr6 [Deltaproteobacteria bacterium]
MVEISRRHPRGSPDRTDRGGQSSGPQRGGDLRSGSSGGGDRPAAGGSYRAAVPWYVGQNFSDAPPGHRYLSYLPFWKSDWSAIKDGKQKVLKELGALPAHVDTLMRALAARQRDVGEASGAEILPAVSTSPFATGLGWEHPNENGFAFLQPYGLPYLAGSGVKGVVRQAAQQLAKDNDESANHGWNHNVIEKLFGLEPAPGSDNATRGALRFFDVIPELVGNAMNVDIMNPHYSEYYQGKSTPHDAGSPIPIFFLVVPPGSKFTFVVDCPRERTLPAELAARWRELLRAAFEHAFDWLGFGAKTAVGYGAMSLAPASATKPAIPAPEPEAERKVTKEPSARPQTVASDTKQEVWDKATISWNDGGGGVVKVEAPGPKRAEARGKAAQDFLATLTEQQQKQLLERKKALTNVRVLVEISGNQRTLKRRVD